jgi:hypothetical protein
MKPFSTPWKDRVAGRIARACTWLHLQFVRFMEQRFSRTSPRRLKRLLFLFCLASGGFSIYLAATAVFGPARSPAPLELRRFQVPRHVDQSGHEPPAPANLVPRELILELQAYRRYMDSTGQVIRPGLLDSMRLLEDIYHQQTPF